MNYDKVLMIISPPPMSKANESSDDLEPSCLVLLLENQIGDGV